MLDFGVHFQKLTEKKRNEKMTDSTMAKPSLTQEEEDVEFPTQSASSNLSHRVRFLDDEADEDDGDTDENGTRIETSIATGNDDEIQQGDQVSTFEDGLVVDDGYGDLSKTLFRPRTVAITQGSPPQGEAVLGRVYFTTLDVLHGQLWRQMWMATADSSAVRV